MLNYNNTKFLIGGDFNINLLNDNNIIQSYKDEIHSQGTIQLVKFPTRLSPINNNRSLLDHMYTNVSENKTTTKCLSYDISDHLPILTFIKSFQINSNKSTYRKILIRDLSRFNPEEFLQELESKISLLNLDNSCVNKLWDQFELLFNSVVMQYAPLRPQTRRERKRRYKPYITNTILSSIKKKQKLFKRVLNNPSNENWEAFKICRNKLTR